MYKQILTAAFLVSPLAHASSSEIVETGTSARATRDNFGIAQSLAPFGSQVIALPAELQNSVRMYLDRIYRELDLPHDAHGPRPDFYLVDNFAEAFFVPTGHPEIMYWNARLWEQTPFEDVDLLHMALGRGRLDAELAKIQSSTPGTEVDYAKRFRHAIAHSDYDQALVVVKEYQAHNQTEDFSPLLNDVAGPSDRTEDYKTSILAIMTRLFRENERVGKEPAPALAHIPTLLEYLDASERTYVTISARALATGLRGKFVEQRLLRSFPETATKRTGVAELEAFLKNKFEDEKMASTTKDKSSWTSWTSWLPNIGMLSASLPEALVYLRVRLAKELTDHLAIIRILDKERQRNPLAREAMREWMLGEFGAAVSTVPNLGPTEYESKYLSKWQSGLFGPMSRVSPTLFHDWEKFGASLKDQDLLKQDWDIGCMIARLEQEEDLSSEFYSRLVFGLTDRSSVRASTPRTLGYMLRHGRKVDFARYPMLSFVLQVLMLQAENHFDFKEPERLRRPLVLKRFRRVFAKSLAETTDASVVGSVLVRELEADAGQGIHLTRFFFEFDHQKVFPGLAKYILDHADLRGQDGLKMALTLPHAEVLSALRARLDKGEVQTVFSVLDSVRGIDRRLFKRMGLEKIAIEVLRHPNGIYIKGLARSALLEDVKPGDPFAQALTERALRDPLVFMHNAALDERLGGPLFAVLDWNKIFSRLDAGQSLTMLRSTHGTRQHLTPTQSVAFETAACARIIDLIARGSDTSLPLEALEYLRSTSADAQKIVTFLFRQPGAELTHAALEARLRLLEKINLRHFENQALFADKYVETFVLLSGGASGFPRMNFAALKPKLNFIRKHFDLTVTQALLSRIAQAYQADYGLQGEFTISTDKDADQIEDAIRTFEVWEKIFGFVSSHQVLDTIETLRADKQFDDYRRAFVQGRLARLGISVPLDEIESYLRNRFRALTPLQRAGVVQILLEASTRMLESNEFRRKVFKNILDNIPNRKVRRTFLDLWDAGMAALPASLRSLVISVVLSESGRYGSPEKALVTLISYLDPLTQKRGQNLAFANLPESYRKELRNLWDLAQSLSWWKAWELILVQYGDIRQSGYTLTGILNSGTTVSYLEITSMKTGEAEVLPVYRDGVQQAIKVGGDQIDTFDRVLVKKNRRKYGFLPLLAADARRKMRLELDPEYKRRMTDRMGEAYKKAALRLGWTVTPDGIIDSGRFHFTTVKSRPVDLGQTTFYLQDKARGIPLRRLKEKNAAKYTDLTTDLLRLEAEVQKDPESPIDADRMPGQNIFDEDRGLNYILDAGQARELEPKVHEIYNDFMNAGFAGDVKTMARQLEELTGVKPKRLFVGGRVRGADVGVRPLVYMQEVSAAFLKMESDDPRQEKFFQLFHAVYSKLRLLQWESDDGLNELGAEVEESVIAKHGKLVLGVRHVLNVARTHTLNAWDYVREKLLGYIGLGAVRRMDRAYLRPDVPPKPETAAPTPTATPTDADEVGASPESSPQTATEECIHALERAAGE